MILNKSNRLFCIPCPGSEKFGCEEIGKRRNQDVRIFSQEDLVEQEDGLGKFYD
jgi:hypothetical protein